VPTVQSEHRIRRNAIDIVMLSRRQAPARPPFGPTKKCTGINVQKKKIETDQKLSVLASPLLWILGCTFTTTSYHLAPACCCPMPFRAGVQVHRLAERQQPVHLPIHLHVTSPRGLSHNQHTELSHNRIACIRRRQMRMEAPGMVPEAL